MKKNLLLFALLLLISGVMFGQEKFTITVNASLGGTAYIGDDPDLQEQRFSVGDTCTVHAMPDTGYTFANWTEDDNVVSTDASYEFTVTANRNLVANFASNPQTYTINVSANPSSGGTVTGGGSYQQGESCTVTATANTGYTFLRWTENGAPVSTNASYTFTVTGNRTLVAHFQQQTYTINVSANPSNGGTVTGDGTYQHGQTCTVTATPATGYTFLRWTENGIQVSTNPSYTFTVTSNHNLVAQFQVNSYTINVSASPSNGGTVTGDGTYQHGQTCTVTATPATDYTFLRWTENDNEVSTDASYEFTVTANRNLVANFASDTQTYTISVSATEGGVAYVGDTLGTLEGTFSYGDTCTVHAVADTGYTFANWTENDSVVSTDANYHFAVESDRALVANFMELQPDEYNIQASPNPSNAGTVTGANIYHGGDECILKAIANNGYAFLYWMENDTVVSDHNEYSFIVNSDRVFVAQFQQQSYTITATSNSDDGGTVSGGGIYVYNATCTLTATPNPGYTFDNWMNDDGVIQSTDRVYSFTVTDNASYIATFTPIQQYTITVRSNNDDWGTVYGGGQYLTGVECVLEATPAHGYQFVHWKMNGTVVSTNPTYSFDVTGDATFIAHFREIPAAHYTINIENSLGGIVSVDQDEATAGTTITITITEDDGFELDTITVYNTDNPSQTVQVTNYEFTMPNYSVTVKAEFKQKALEIDPPAPICSGESLTLTEPHLLLPAISTEWQLSPTEDFDPENTITYTNQGLDASYDGWYLRYRAKYLVMSIYSNIVQITVHSLAEMTMEGEGSASLDQAVEYKIIIGGQNDNADYSFDWSVSDGQADVAVLDNSCKVTWKTTGTQHVSVVVTDETTGCTITLGMDVNVTACIDNLQEIVAKEHKDGSKTYDLILVYPNPDNEEYTYQWLYSSDGEIYHELTGEASKKQYYYKGGRLNDGYYKVRISKDGCSEETLPCHVNHGGRLHIYPNPSHRGTGVVVVNDGDSPALLAIYSTDGRLLHTQTVTSDQATFGINLPQGVYVVYLTDSEGHTKVDKLIIQ